MKRKKTIETQVNDYFEIIESSILMALKKQTVDKFAEFNDLQLTYLIIYEQFHTNHIIDGADFIRIAINQLRPGTNRSNHNFSPEIKDLRISGYLQFPEERCFLKDLETVFDLKQQPCLDTLLKQNPKWGTNFQKFSDVFDELKKNLESKKTNIETKANKNIDWNFFPKDGNNKSRKINPPQDLKNLPETTISHEINTILKTLLNPSQ